MLVSRKQSPFIGVYQLAPFLDNARHFFGILFIHDPKEFHERLRRGAHGVGGSVVKDWRVLCVRRHASADSVVPTSPIV
jgi:hypothetical protein